MKIFIEEGLENDLGQITFDDNKEVIKLIEDNRVGIFNLLDESCAVSTNDEGFLSNIRKSLKGNVVLRNPKMSSDPTFIIVHTAKDVEYTVLGFRQKNKDELNPIALVTFSNSSNEIIQYNYRATSEKKQKYLAG